MPRSLFAPFAAFVLFCTLAPAQSKAPLHVYIDADFSSSPESSKGIELGVRTALAMAGDQLGDHPVRVIPLDHMANVRRSAKNLGRWLEDDRAITMFCGLHSPPVLKLRDRINAEGVLFLDPWAAATPITRATDDRNWIFRLSIDDSKVGGFLVSRAKEAGHKRPFLLLEKTGWGNSNHKVLSHPDVAGDCIVGTERFAWGIARPAAQLIAARIASSGADHLIFVGNLAEFSVLAEALLNRDETRDLPIYSHWGILGADLPRAIARLPQAPKRLKVVRTPFVIGRENPTPFQLSVIGQARKTSPEFLPQRGMAHEPAFVHAFDLTRLLIAACEDIRFGERPKEQLPEIRNRLQRLNEPVQGLLKTYRSPFRPWSGPAGPGTPEFDAHEALGTADLVLGRVTGAGLIEPISSLDQTGN